MPYDTDSHWTIAAENVVAARQKMDELTDKTLKAKDQLDNFAAMEQEILKRTVQIQEEQIKMASQEAPAGMFVQAMDRGLAAHADAEKAARFKQMYNATYHPPSENPCAEVPICDPFGAPDAQKWCDEVLAEPVEEQVLPFQALRQEETLVWYPRKNHRPGGDYDDAVVAQMQPLHHYNVQDLLARFFIGVHAQWGVVPNWRQNVIGVTSYYCGPLMMSTPGGAHLPMFDYDGKNVKKIIRKDVKALQEEHSLGDAWVFETRRGFHVYFLTDVVARDRYYEMLQQSQSCKGFKKASLRRGYAVLRVSAKYTDFDIQPLYVLASKNPEPRRMNRKAHTIQALIGLGQECGTHFASMFPQWAHFQQDPKEWKPSAKKPSAKRIRKTKDGHDERSYYTKDNNLVKKMTMEPKMYSMGVDTGATSSASVTYTTTTTAGYYNGGYGNGGGTGDY